MVRFLRLGLVGSVGLILVAACTPAPTTLWPEVLTRQAIPGSSAYASSLVLSREGHPLVAFVSGPPECIVYFWRDGAAAEPVGPAGDRRHTEINLDLALAPDGDPGIAYVDDRVGDLVYAERNDGRWITTTVDATGQVGHFPSLAYDRTGNPHISYFDNTNNDIKYATRQPTGWRIETIDASGQPGFHIPAGFTQLVLGPDPDSATRDLDTPAVAYLAYRYKPYDGALRFAVRGSAGWRIATVDAARSAGGFPALALDAYGQPWIAYYRAGTWDYQVGELRVAHRVDQSWHIDVIDQDDNAGRFSALAFGPANQPVIAYYAAKTGSLRLAWHDETWHHGTLLPERDIGSWVSLAMDEQGRAHLTYANGVAETTTYVQMAMSALVAP